MSSTPWHDDKDFSKGIEGVHWKRDVSMVTEQEEAWSGKEMKRVLMRRIIPSLQDRPWRGS
jgi:hypothetical protein